MLLREVKAREGARRQGGPVHSPSLPSLPRPLWEPLMDTSSSAPASLCSGLPPRLRFSSTTASCTLMELLD